MGGAGGESRYIGRDVGEVGGDEILKFWRETVVELGHKVQAPEGNISGEERGESRIFSKEVIGG